MSAPSCHKRLQEGGNPGAVPLATINHEANRRGTIFIRTTGLTSRPYCIYIYMTSFVLNIKTYKFSFLNVFHSHGGCTERLCIQVVKWLEKAWALRRQVDKKSLTLTSFIIISPNYKTMTLLCK